MIIYCTLCGKKCETKPIKIEKGIVDPKTFKCSACNKKHHGQNPHPDFTIQRRLKELARCKEIIT